MKKIIFALFLLLLVGFVSALTIEEINLQSGEKTPIVFFKTETCPNCAAVDAWLQGIEPNYENIIVYRLYPNEETELLMKLYDIYDVPINERNYVPIIFLSDKHYLGRDTAINNLENDFKSFTEKKELLTGKENGNEESEINLFYVLSLALVDAVNPCELAVLIILMTAILTRFPEKKGKALKAGLLFTLAIFIMYFIFGLFLVELFSFVSNTFGYAFMIIIAILAIILGLLNIKDYFNYGGGGFIMEVPQKWRPKMKEIINGTTSPKGAFIVGLIVSFFLTPCTAGPYFIFSGLMSQIGLLNALPYLFVYMIIFISPMLAITFITYFGFAQVKDMEEWRGRNLKKLHLIAGLIMLVIGAWLILTTFGII